LAVAIEHLQLIHIEGHAVRTTGRLAEHDDILCVVGTTPSRM
jgi:hypothetical protein